MESDAENKTKTHTLYSNLLDEYKCATISQLTYITKGEEEEEKRRQPPTFVFFNKSQKKSTCLTF